MRHTIALLAAAATAYSSRSRPYAADSPPFPRLAGVNNGGPHNYDDPAYQAKLAKLNFSVADIWVGWDSTRDMTMEQVVRNIKALNPESKVFLYENSMEVADDNAAASTIFKKVEQMKWWAFPRGGDGEALKSPFGQRTSKPNFLINTTLFTPRDSSGYQQWEWHARWVVQQYYKPNPSIDGFFEDNVFWKPRVDVDWNRDGIDRLEGLPAGRQMAARRLSQALRADAQADAGQAHDRQRCRLGPPNAVLTELDQTLNGGVIEGILGASYSPET